MKYIALLTLLCFGCAYGKASGPPGCYVSGFVVGRSRIHATCVPAKKIETPIKEEATKIMPIHDGGMNNCPGNYNYFHECIDDESKSDILKASSEEGYVEIAGAPPSTSFWSTIFDFLVLAGTAAMTYFKVGG